MQRHIGECDGGGDQWGHPSSPAVGADGGGGKRSRVGGKDSRREFAW